MVDDRGAGGGDRERKIRTYSTVAIVLGLTILFVSWFAGPIEW